MLERIIRSIPSICYGAASASFGIASYIGHVGALRDFFYATPQGVMENLQNSNPGKNISSIIHDPSLMSSTSSYFYNQAQIGLINSELLLLPTFMLAVLAVYAYKNR